MSSPLASPAPHDGMSTSQASASGDTPVLPEDCFLAFPASALPPCEPGMHCAKHRGAAFGPLYDPMLLICVKYRCWHGDKRVKVNLPMLLREEAWRALQADPGQQVQVVRGLVDPEAVCRYFCAKTLAKLAVQFGQKDSRRNAQCPACPPCAPDGGEGTAARDTTVCEHTRRDRLLKGTQLAVGRLRSASGDEYPYLSARSFLEVLAAPLSASREPPSFLQAAYAAPDELGCYLDLGQLALLMFEGDGLKLFQQSQAEFERACNRLRHAKQGLRTLEKSYACRTVWGEDGRPSGVEAAPPGEAEEEAEDGQAAPVTARPAKKRSQPAAGEGTPAKKRTKK